MWSLLKAFAKLTAALVENTLALMALREVTTEQTRSNRTLTVNIDALNQNIVKLIAVIQGPVADPDPISLLVYAEDGSMLVFKINLPGLPEDPNAAKQITGGELTVMIGTADPVVISTAVGQAVVEGLKGNDGESVKASFAFLDTATPPNKSVHPSTIDAVLSDTIPPADPGILSLEVTGEE